MTTSWNKEYNPSQLAEKIEDSRKAVDGGGVKFEGWGLKEYETILFSMLNFPENVPEIEARRMVTKAIFTSGTKGKITAKSLLAEVNKLEHDYVTLPIQRYALATSISLNTSLTLQRLRQNGNLIIFERNYPERFRNEASDLIEQAREQSLFFDPPTNYMRIRIHVSAKSIHEAANEALDTIDYIRGIWNWANNRRHFFRISMGKPMPVNEIVLGPLHTLHLSTGQLAATDTWWYEPSYLGPIKLYKPSQGNVDNIFNKPLIYMRKRLKNHNYPKVMQNALIRYTRALDYRDWSTSFLKLWGVLELLTDTIGASYEITVKRTSYIFQERDYHLQVLQHLRKHRNSSVHFDRENSEIETCMYQLKNFVEALIGFHVSNKYGFNSIQEAASFLSLPYKNETLTSHINKLQFARKFRGYDRKP
jgi:hypothetical protein